MAITFAMDLPRNDIFGSQHSTVWYHIVEGRTASWERRSGLSINSKWLSTDTELRNKLLILPSRKNSILSIPGNLYLEDVSYTAGGGKGVSVSWLTYQLWSYDKWSSWSLKYALMCKNILQKTYVLVNSYYDLRLFGWKNLRRFPVHHIPTAVYISFTNIIFTLLVGIAMNSSCPHSDILRQFPISITVHVSN